uniref:Protein MON2 homolog n=1 Tax=Syphacia muris TaxID=451379 RepID=A0A0N5A8N7_9BILA
MSSTNGIAFGAADVKRLVENLLTDLRSLSTEAKKKQVQVKEAAESGLVKIRNINSASNEQNLAANLRLASSELLQPLVMGCASKNARLVQISLQAIQRMVQHRVIEPTSAPVIVNELWQLMEAECEELRVLQTLTSFVSTELLVTGPWLARCLVMCFRLNFAKDPIVINTASATVRQMVNCVYERVINEENQNLETASVYYSNSKANSLVPPSTLKPCAADGFMLFRDLCLLTNAESPCWLVGIKEMTRTLGLELVESVLAGYSKIFFMYPEYAQLLKDQVCPLIIRLFSPNQKHVQLMSQHPHSPSSRASLESAVVGQLPSTLERPSFPVSMRLLRVVVVLITQFYRLLITECEIFLSLLIKFLEMDKAGWQRAITLEVIHRIIAQPELLLWFCEHYDARSSASKVISTMISVLSNYVQTSFYRPDVINIVVREEEQFEAGTSSLGQMGFLHRGVWIPLCQNLAPKKSILLDSLDKHDAILLPEGYSLSLTYFCIIDCCKCILQAYELSSQKDNTDTSLDVTRELFQSCYASLLAAISLLLDASTDETVTDQLVDCLGIIVNLACHLNHNGGKDASVVALCKAALPTGYFTRILGTINSPATSNSSSSVYATNSAESSKNNFDNLEKDSISGGQPSQVVAVGTVCPTPSLPSTAYSAQVMLTGKNLQVFRTLIICAETNGQQLNDSWCIVLTTIQHVVWILGMKPNLSGEFRSIGDNSEGSTSNINSSLMLTSVVTTAVLTDVGVLGSMLNDLFESTSKLDDVALHHVIAALCKLSSEAMTVFEVGSREPSFFPVAKLQQTAMANLSRVGVFWKPITAHLIDVSGHPSPSFREWGAQALTTLVKNAMKSAVYGEDEVVGFYSYVVSLVKRQQFILSPLLSLCEIEYPDVRKKQMECLMSLLQSAGQQLTAEQWPTVIEIVASIVSSRFTFEESLIKQSYEAVALIVTDFLDVLSLQCVQMLVETDAKYGAQQRELNISLSALGQLWTISDYIYRKSSKLSDEESDRIWLVLYNCLSELCVDARPPVRKSACQTLLQTINAHGRALKPTTWKHMLWKILFPMLDKVRAITRNASNVRTDSTALGASNILIHHSRDTEYKQWAETSVQTLNGIVKIFNTQRNLLIAFGNFDASWSTLLQYIEYLALSDNPEMSLAGLRNFQEVLLGRTQNVDRATKSSEITPQYVPSPSHLATLLNIFPTLFEHVKDKINVEELKSEGLPSILKSVIGVPIGNEQSAFLVSSTDISPTQAAVLECVKIVYRELVDTNSHLRSALPDLLRLLLHFSVLAVQVPYPEFLGGKINDTQWWVQNVTPFAELCLRTVVEFYAYTAHYQEIIQTTILVDIVEALSIPMRLKYACFSRSSWKAAASAFITTLRLGLPIARQNVALFHKLWPLVADTLHSFLFNTSHSTISLNADERKRHEFIDCQLIELIRSEVLPYVTQFPNDFVQRIIEILNRGSVCTLDPRDVLESYMQRSDLSKACFDALLSMSQKEKPAFKKNTSSFVIGSIVSTFGSDIQDQTGDVNRKGSGVSKPLEKSTFLGQSAIRSLLSRCKEVIKNFVRDEQNSGHMRLPQERLIEMVNVLSAIQTLNEGITQRSNPIDSGFYSELVSMYSLLIDCIPSSKADPRVEQTLMAAFKSYETIFYVKLQQ